MRLGRKLSRFLHNSHECTVRRPLTRARVVARRERDARTAPPSHLARMNMRYELIKVESAKRPSSVPACRGQRLREPSRHLFVIVTTIFFPPSNRTEIARRGCSHSQRLYRTRTAVSPDASQTIKMSTRNIYQFYRNVVTFALQCEWQIKELYSAVFSISSFSVRYLTG